MAVSIALPSPSPFVTPTQIPRLLKIYYSETNLLPENHSYISVSTKRKKILCWNILVEHTKGSSTDELWTIPWDTAQHESLGIYRFLQYLWVIWSLQPMKINSSIQCLCCHILSFMEPARLSINLTVNTLQRLYSLPRFVWNIV